MHALAYISRSSIILYSFFITLHILGNAVRRIELAGIVTVRVNHQMVSQFKCPAWLSF